VIRRKGKEGRPNVRGKSDSFAEIVDIGVAIDVGAPLPHLVSDGQRAVVVFRSGLPRDRDWDGSSVTIVDPGSDDVTNLGWVIFEGVYHVSLGPPNDEALAGHPLHGSGLEYYAAHEVRNSDLIATLEQRNRVHRHHRPESFESLRHVIITFHDETLECVCRSWKAGPLEAGFGAAVTAAVDALRTGEMVDG